MPFTLDTKILRQLRETFLTSPGRIDNDYWMSRAHLEQYDATFAQRIAWKWDAVLAAIQPSLELILGRANTPPTLVDIGCGTGIATRRVLAHVPKAWRSLVLCDRSVLALEFAREKIRADLAQRDQSLEIQISSTISAPSGSIVLLSHLLNELPERVEQLIRENLAGAAAIIWVEPGERAVSRRLSDVRESLLKTHTVLSPCPHQLACPLAGTARPDDWCHQFAKPPAEIFQQSFWGVFAKELGIDLRSLPLSFLFLVAKDLVRSNETPPHVTANSARLIGRPNVGKGTINVDVCTAQGTYRRDNLSRRDYADLFGTLKRTSFDILIPPSPPDSE